MTVKLLIGVLSPRRIPIFQWHINRLPYDKLVIKYHKKEDAYYKVRKYFLDNKEYTHLALLPDDLLVRETDISILLDDISAGDYPVLCGMCNITALEPDTLNICNDLPTVDRNTRVYNWLKVDDPIFNNGDNIIKVGFAGFPFTIFERSVIEKIPFRSDIDGPNGCCYDVMFCNDCASAGIPIHVDKRVNMWHLKKDWEGELALLVGKMEPYVYVEVEKSGNFLARNA